MRTGYQVAQELKTVKTPNNNDRLAKAIYLVNAVAYAVPMTPGMSVADFVESAQVKFKRLINDVNDHTPVDTKLAQALFDKALRVRYELAYGTVDPTIVQAAMKSLTAEDYANAEQVNMTDWLVTRADFTRSQIAMGQALQEYFVDGE